MYIWSSFGSANRERGKGFLKILFYLDQTRVRLPTECIGLIDSHPNMGIKDIVVFMGTVGTGTPDYFY